MTTIQGEPAHAAVNMRMHKALLEPFPADEIEWRIQQSGLTKSGKPYAMVLAYVTARAVMNRLDAVFGPSGWSDRYAELTDETGKVIAVKCRLRCRFEDDWVEREDIAEATDIESWKGAFSGSLKRAAVKFGIGRYLYYLETGWANIHSEGKHRGNAAKGGQKVYFKWDPPKLPAWALPEEDESEADFGIPATAPRPTTVGPTPQEELEEEEEDAARPAPPQAPEGAIPPERRAPKPQPQRTAPARPRANVSFADNKGVTHWREWRMPYKNEFNGLTLLDMAERHADKLQSTRDWLFSRYDPSSKFARFDKETLDFFDEALAYANELAQQDGEPASVAAPVSVDNDDVHSTFDDDVPF